MKFLGGHDDDAAVARAEIEHLLAGFQPAQLEHLFDDRFGRRIIRGEFIALAALRGQA